MRITLISKACIVGAYQRKLEEIAAHDDVHLTVVVPPFWREGQRVSVLERAHVRGYELIVAPLALNGHFHLHFYPSLARILRRTRPDLVHIDEEPYNLATYLALKATRRMGTQALFFTWQNIFRRYPPPFCWFEQYVHRHSAGAIAGNVEAAEVLRAKGFRGPLRIIPQFGIDPELFAPMERPVGREFTVGYAGRLVAEKGLLTLIEALALLGGHWRFLVCGAGPLRQEMETRLGHLALLGRVEFRGQVPSAQMPEWYRQMDVLVLPSRTQPNWKEQFGRVLIEAMACGVAVIGSDSGEIPNVIGEAGLVFPEGDAQALANLLATLRDNPDQRQDLARRGRRRVLDHFTQARIAAETVDFYRSLVGARQAC
ncbi:MAG: glycosyltransferase family 4 protein [Chloroflexi bacterium]|nr:glycosyltransferase family 4 protein [Chloroflexota bacterium]